MTTRPDQQRPPIAIVGVSALFPGSLDSTGFWHDILSGTDRMTDVPPSHWLIEDHYDPDITANDKTYGRRGGFLDPVDLDVMGFGIPPSSVPSTDTAQLLALIVAQRVLDDAMRGQFSDLDRSRASVILGVTSGQELFGAMASRMNRPMWLQGMRRAGVAEDVALAACDEISGLHPEWTESTFPGLLGNVVAGRIANRLDLGGTNCVTDAACASSFSAISMGVNELYLGDSDLVIAGGVDTMNDIFMYMCFSKTPALSKSEEIRPFSDKADGTMLGEGVGMFALKRLEDAENDGNDIYCVINGVGSSSDGRSKSVYAPVSSGQARALDNAYAKAGYGPDSVELVEAHGTGTVAGDAAEFGGLELAFGAPGRTDRQWCALGSVKSQIGHTKAAAGAAGLFKVVMALRHKVLPQTAKIDQPNPELDLENSPFHLNTRTRPWVRPADHERRGSVSSFGFGGSNFHITLSEYVGAGKRAPRLRTTDSELVVLCGIDGADVVDQARRHLDVPAGMSLVRLAGTSQAAYASGAPARLAVVADDEEELRTRLEQAVERIEQSPMSPFSTPTGTCYGLGPQVGDVAFVFPGQGSQYVSMGGALAMHLDIAMSAWDLAADREWPDRTVQDVVFPITSFADGAHAAEDEMLTATQWAQPAIGIASLAMLRVLRSIGVDAAQVGGHSFGEITALHAAGVLSDVDLIEVATRRGELMAEAAQSPGSMTAVTGSVEQVRELVEQSVANVVVANHNSPNQVVLSGATDAIEQIEAHLRDAGVAAKRLPVATAFHSPVVSGASAAFGTFLDGIRLDPPTVPVFANETAAPYPGADADAVRAQVGRQLANPVRFVEMIEAMYDQGARTFVEVGPGSILTGLIGRILDGREHTAIPLDKHNNDAMAPFFRGIGQLVASGVDMDLTALWSEYEDMTTSPEIDPPKLAIAIDGANVGSLYPPQDLTELVGPNTSSASGPEPDRYFTPHRATSDPAFIARAAAENPAPATSASPGPSNAAPPVSAPPVAAPPAVASPVEAGRSAALQRPAPVRPDTSAPAGVLAAYQVAQQQTADAHMSYLDSMARAHSAFLDASRQSLSVLGQLAGVDVTLEHRAIAPPPDTPAPAPAAVSVATEAPVDAPSIPAAPVAVATATVDMTEVMLTIVADRTGYPADMLAMQMELEADLGIDSIKRVEILSAVQDRVPELPDVDLAEMAALTTLGEIVDYLDTQNDNGRTTSSPAAPVTPAAPPVAPATVDASPVAVATATVDMTEVMLTIVADRTGYPADMLAMQMELEADLGIDSIKRVEILSAVQDRVPELPDVDLAEMAALTTLGEIVDYLDTQNNNGRTPSPSSSTAGRFTLEMVPTPATGTELAGLRDGPIAVVDDGEGVGPALVAALIADRVDAHLTQTDPDSNDAGVILLGALRDFADDAGAIAVNREAFAIAQAFAQRSPRAGVFVTVTDIGGRFGTDGSDERRVWSAGLSGLARTAAIEWPTTAIAEELLRGGSELEVGIACNGTRIALHSVKTEVEHGTMSIGADDVIVVSGGGRGVTATTTIELARATGAAFVLLGRSELVDEQASHANADESALKRIVLDEATTAGENMTPSELSRVVDRVLAVREVRQTITEIEQAGGRARYLQVDITDTAAVAGACDIVRREVGPITGVVHGAGVLADKMIADKTEAQFDRVFDTKVIGLRNLLEATATDELVLLCLFSSVAARTGNTGQVDYAMANEILNKVAVNERLRRDGCVVKSLGWGPWSGGMVTPSLRSHFESMGVELIALADGAQMFVDEIASTQHDQVDVVLGSGVLGAGESVRLGGAPPAERIDA